MMTPSEIAEVFNQYRDRLLRFAQRRMGCPHTAADVVQQAFNNVINNATLREASYLRAYLYQSVRNLCINQFQARDIARKYRSSLQYHDELRRTEAMISPEEALAKHQLLAALQNEVDHLSPQLRTAFTLVELQHHTVREAAALMDCTEMAVHKQINRAYAVLAERMSNYPF